MRPLVAPSHLWYSGAPCDFCPSVASELFRRPLRLRLTTNVQHPGSEQTAKSNAQMYFPIAVAMAGAMMFELDQGNFGNVQTYESFQTHWCEGKFGNAVSCHSPGVDENAELMTLSQKLFIKLIQVE